MRKTQGVSIPRSGHSAVYTLARAYFEDAFVYCDANNPAKCGCEQSPCINPGTTFSKNHDFGLLKHRNPFDYRDRYRFKHFIKHRGRPRYTGVSISRDLRYFIQYRSPFRCIPSNFKLYLKKNPDKNYRANWERFARMDMIYWNRFIDKWVLGFPRKTIPPLYCSYESLVADPETRAREILEFLADGPLDEDRFKTVISQHPIIERTALTDFEFFDPVFFKELEKMSSGRLIKLGLPTL